MARRCRRPRPTQTKTLTPVVARCPECGHRLWATESKHRTITTLSAVTRLTLRIRRCPNPDCSRYHRPYRPEAESLLALPHHEFGLDVLALVGRLRHAEHRSVPEIHQELTRRGVVVAVRSVSNLLDRYDELRALATADRDRLHAILSKQRRVVLAIDGQSTIRKAVAQALPGVPNQLCHFHYLREAARPIYEADRHAKKELKKRVRGIRPIERQAEEDRKDGDDDGEADLVRDYCAAVRAALTDDGLPPLVASGLKLHDRLSRIAASLDRVAARAGGLSVGLKRLQHLLRRGLEETAALWPPVREAYKWVKRVARLLKNKEKMSAKEVRRRLVQLLGRMRQAAAIAVEPSVRKGLRHFLKVSQSYWPGLFRCYESSDLPRTNNDLEHAFGSHRYHERRASGRRRASPGLVVMGSARLISGLATRLRPEEGLLLPSGYVERWRELRAGLERRREARRKQRRFRRDPLGYLAELEQRCLQPSLPT